MNTVAKKAPKAVTVSQPFRSYHGFSQKGEGGTRQATLVGTVHVLCSPEKDFWIFWGQPKGSIV